MPLNAAESFIIRVANNGHLTLHLAGGQVPGVVTSIPFHGIIFTFMSWTFNCVHFADGWLRSKVLKENEIERKKKVI